MSLVDEMWINDEKANKFTGVVLYISLQYQLV